MHFRTGVLVMAAAVSMAAHAATLHKCKSDDGRVYYSDTACGVGGETVRKRKLRSSEDADAGVPAAMTPQQAEAQRSRFAEVLSSLGGLKAEVVEYYRSHGSWPPAGVAPSSWHSAFIDRVALLREGIIEAALNESFGAGKSVVFTPKEVLGGTHIEWHCTTNVSRQVLDGSMQSLCTPEASR